MELTDSSLKDHMAAAVSSLEMYFHIGDDFYIFLNGWCWSAVL